jgi:hypothetical protein
MKLGNTKRRSTVKSPSIRDYIGRALGALLRAASPAPSPVPVPVKHDDRPLRVELGSRRGPTDWPRMTEKETR